MKILAYILIGGFSLIVLFLIWRITSVARGQRKRDEKLLRELDPLAKRLEANERVERDEVLFCARKPQLRYPLYRLLKHFRRPDLFPPEFLSDEAQGAARLAYWMMHPNELQDPPKEIELVERVVHPIQGEECSFLVYRYRMPEDHWAGNDWILGLAGPFAKNHPPYEGPAGAFSRCDDKPGALAPAELVDWLIGMATRKSS
jgi:hypothetical protein